MLAKIGGRRDRRTAGLILAALALVLRLVFPSGFMLSTGRTELPGIVICTGQGAVTLAVGEDGRPLKPGHPSGADKTSHPCTFAVAASAAMAPIPVAILAPRAVNPLGLAPLKLTQRPGLGLAAPPPLPTGPPRLSIA